MKTAKTILRQLFRKRVLEHYKKHGRHDLPWRNTHAPYRILVSEIMLQQTQVDRVIPKYASFLKKFPTFQALATAPLRSVLMEWKGLGYNRRALNLKRTAQIVMTKHGGALPRDMTALLQLPGIGTYTAGAIRAFAWNEPGVFIETNIRTAYIYHYADKRGQNADSGKVHDNELLPLIEATMDKKDPRTWYYALMDYGAHLKKTVGNLSQKSSTYTKQSKFEGSKRQLRARVLHEITARKSAALVSVAKALGKKRSEITPIIKELERDGFVVIRQSKIEICGERR